MERDEVELIKKAQDGDKMAFQELMNRHGERVMCGAYKFTKNHQDAEDLYQETFIRVYKNIESFRFESEFYTWVYRIMANLAFNLYRKQKRMQTIEPEDEDYFWQTIPADESSNSDRKLYLTSIKEQVDQALLGLSPKQRTVFIMKHYEAKKIRDISAILGCTDGTVKRYLYRATQKLQKMLSSS